MDRYLDKASGPMMRFFDIIYKLFYLNVLFVAHTLLGAVIVGFYPSLLTLFRLSKRVFHDHEDNVSYHKEYFRIWKSLLGQGNALFAVSLVIGAITVMDMIFLYDNYLGVDELTVFGVVLSLGGLLLAYVVGGLLAMIPVTVAFYERFAVRDALKFAFFQTLSAPLLVLSYLFVLGGSYLVFSVLVSAAPFLGASLPAWLMVLLYGRVYFKIFRIREHDGYHYMSFRYNRDEAQLADVLQSQLADPREHIDGAKLHAMVNAADVSVRDSIVVIDQGRHVIGFLLARRNAEDELAIELLAVKKDLQHRGIGTSMLDILLRQNDGTTVVMSTDKSAYHPSCKEPPFLATLLQQHGFVPEPSGRYVKHP